MVSRDRYHDLESMPAVVRLNDIVEILEVQFEESSSFLDRETGEVTIVSRELLLEAEECGDDEEPDFLAWQRNLLKLPSKFDVHEWSIMQDFSRSVEHDRIREDLLRAIQGAGAFRYFKDTLRRHRMEAAWFAFRTEALRQIAIDWCEKNQIVWE